MDVIRSSTLSEKSCTGTGVCWQRVGEASPSVPYTGLMLWVASAILGGYLLFCHGCHEDVDDEALRPGLQSSPALTDGAHA
jgi:hypothetical protein